MTTHIISDEDIPTPEELAERMRSLADIPQQDIRHVRMDSVLTTVLEMLGYSEAVKIFNDTSKWYS